MAMVRENRKLTLLHVPASQILAMKVDKLVPGSVVHGVCCELATRRNTILEQFSGRNILTLINHCYRACSPKLQRIKKPTRNERRHAHTTALILSRRRNGSL
jgi:hypothetical protein